MTSAAVLVTGASGFIGSHLLEALAARGVRPRALARRTSIRDPHASVDWVDGSLEDSDSLRRAVAGAGVVYHLAGLTKAVQPGDFDRANAEGTARLAEACRAEGVGHLVLLSSLAAVGPSTGERPRLEDDPPQPVGAYGRSKLAGERAAAAAGIPLTVLRPPAVYGPRDRDVFLFFQMARRRMILALGDLEARVSVVHAADVAAALLAAGDRQRPGTYFVAEPRAYSWREVFDVIDRTVPGRKLRLRVPLGLATLAARGAEAASRWRGRAAILSLEKLAELRAGSWVCSTEAAERQLGFRASIPFPEGAASTYQWYLNHKWL